MTQPMRLLVVGTSYRAEVTVPRWRKGEGLRRFKLLLNRLH